LLLIVTVQLAVFVPIVGLPQVSDSDVGAGETCGVIEVSDAVEPAGDAFVVIVNTCCSVMPFVASGLIETFASTKRFVADPLPPGPLLPEVERVTSVEFVPSEKCQTAVASAVKTPAELLLIVTVQLAEFVPRVGVEQVSLSDVGAGEMFGVIDVSVAVEPAGSAFVVIVNVCALPTSFTPFGLIETFASTNRFVADPLPPGPLLPEVERVTSVEFVPSLKCHTAVASAVNTPAVLFEIVTVQVAVLPDTVGAAQVSDSESGVGETCGVIDVSVAVEPEGDAVLEIVNVCE
jgi:hypothetical protein